MRVFCYLGGQGEIRTHGTPKRTLDFESSAFDHSATCPVAAFASTRYAPCLVSFAVRLQSGRRSEPSKEVRYSSKKWKKRIMTKREESSGSALRCLALN